MNTETSISKFEQYRKAQARAIKRNKKAVFDALNAAKITDVRVDFDGEGDSGQIGSVTATTGGILVPLPDISLTLYEAPYEITRLMSVPQATLQDAIETLCYCCLAQDHGGWENNDGAYGEFSLDVAKRTIDLEFNGRYTDINTSTHSF